MIGKLFKFLTKMVLWAIFLALIIPVGYFVLRMGQPMDLPEYKGLTYYQYLEWEHLEQEKTLEEYRKNHTVEYDGNVNLCSVATRLTGHAGLFLSQGPALILDSVLLDRPFDPVHFLPNWWESFENEHLVILRGNSSGHPACRIPSAIPDNYALSIGVQLLEDEEVQQ